ERRLGDAVFYTAGIDLASPPPSPLWVVVLWPDPATNPEQASWSITVIDSNGTVSSHGAARFDGPLAMENARRALVGLPPLPHPPPSAGSVKCRAVDRPDPQVPPPNHQRLGPPANAVDLQRDEPARRHRVVQVRRRHAGDPRREAVPHRLDAQVVPLVVPIGA